MLRLVKIGEELKLTPVLDLKETAPEVEIGAWLALKLLTRISTFEEEVEMRTVLPLFKVKVRSADPRFTALSPEPFLRFR